jgi:hypothetical protein
MEFPPPQEGNMDRKRILELALETLEARRTEIERAIAEIREFQDGKKRVFVRNPEISTLVVVKRRSRTAAERKALSRRMKEIWAARKLQAAKPSVSAKTAPGIAKHKPKSAAEKRALSLKMKQVWAKKKAEAAKKA